MLPKAKFADGDVIVTKEQQLGGCGEGGCLSAVKDKSWQPCCVDWRVGSSSCLFLGPKWGRSVSPEGPPRGNNLTKSKMGN